MSVSGGKKYSFFRKIWRALLSCYLRFEIHPFALLLTNFTKDSAFGQVWIRDWFWQHQRNEKWQHDSTSNHTVDCNKIASLTQLFFNCLLLYNCPLLKDISFNTMFVSLVWLTGNHIPGLDNFWDKSPAWFLKTLKLPSFYSGHFKISKMHWAIYHKSPSQTCDY